MNPHKIIKLKITVDQRGQILDIRKATILNRIFLESYHIIINGTINVYNKINHSVRNGLESYIIGESYKFKSIDSFYETDSVSWDTAFHIDGSNILDVTQSDRYITILQCTEIMDKITDYMNNITIDNKKVSIQTFSRLVSLWGITSPSDELYVQMIDGSIVTLKSGTVKNVSLQLIKLNKFGLQFHKMYSEYISTDSEFSYKEFNMFQYEHDKVLIDLNDFTKYIN